MYSLYFLNKLEYFFSHLISIFILIYVPSRILGAMDHNTLLMCSQKGRTVRTESQICVPTGKEGEEEFTKSSVENCVKLKEGCEEVNEAACLWYTLEIKGKSLQFPVCRLMYYPSASFFSFGFGGPQMPWIELFYVNQYGTTNTSSTMFSILEIHRRIFRKDFFPFDSPDFPGNVADPTQVQGLKWTRLSKPASTLPANLCQGGVDACKYCAVNLTNIFKQAYRAGDLGEYKGDKYTATGACGKYLINGNKTDVCRVTFETWVQRKHLNTVKQIVVEAQGYYETSGVVLRYATMGGNYILPSGCLVPDNRTFDQ